MEFLARFYLAFHWRESKKNMVFKQNIHTSAGSIKDTKNSVLFFIFKCNEIYMWFRLLRSFLRTFFFFPEAMQKVIYDSQKGIML